MGKEKVLTILVESALQGEVVYKDSLFNEDKFDDYFRLDIKTTYKINQKK